MSFIETTPAAEATGDVLAMYLRQQRRFGYLPNYATVFCHRPQLMKLWADLQAGIRRNMDARRFELATLAAALALRSSYCSLAHATVLSESFSAEELLAIATGQEGPLSPAETAMMRYAAKVARDASSVDADDVRTLKAHGFSDAEVFDIAITAAGRAFFSKVVEGLGALPDAAYRDMPDALRGALSVGRQPAETASQACEPPP